MRLRFPHSARLTQAWEFARLKREGTSYPGRYFVLSVLLQAEPGALSRVGLITSRRVGGAVQRNRVRRRLRELFRHSRPGMVEGAWLVVIARTAAVQADHAALSREWLHLLGKAKLLPATAA